MAIDIKGLHHHAVRCRDSEETRKFYEDFLGLPFVGALEIKETKSGRKTSTLHTFYRLADGSHLALLGRAEEPLRTMTVREPLPAMRDDPLMFALTDRASYIVALLVILAAMIAA